MDPLKLKYFRRLVLRPRNSQKRSTNMGFSLQCIAGIIRQSETKNTATLIKKSGAVAKSYMTNGLVIYGEIFAHFLIY